MSTSREDIRAWLRDGKARGKTHLVVVCDTWDHDDYPVECESKEAAKALVRNPGSMQRVMEVYNLSMDLESQLAEHRAYNL